MRRTLVLLAALAVGGCYDDDDYDPNVPTEIEAVSGDDQFGDTGTILSEPLVVRVINLEGDPVQGVAIEWFIVNGGGSLSTASTTTDASGLAQVTFTLGGFVGGQEVQAVNNDLAGSPTVFSATARATGGGGPPPE